MSSKYYEESGMVSIWNFTNQLILIACLISKKKWARWTK